MGPCDVSLICYFGGKLIDDDKNAKYIGGSKKGDIVPNSIGFASFKERIKQIVKIPLNGMEFNIKCGVRFDEFTVIGMDVDDDQSLRFVMDRSKFIMAYILEHPPTATTYTTIQSVEDVFPSRAATKYTAIQREDLVLPSAVQFQVKNPIDGTSNRKSVEMETIGLKPPGSDGINTNKGASLSGSKFIEWSPEKLIPFITGYENPEGDGNCGFRALCMALGRDESEWAWMRDRLVKEIKSNNKFYKLLFGLEETMKLVERIWHLEGWAPCPKWMDMPSTGFVFAQAFNVVLVHYSKENCWTFVPSLSPPNADSMDVKVIGIGLVENSHYMKLDLRYGCPLPPFPHVPSSWRTICPGTINSWEELLAPRLRACKTMNIPELQFDKCIGETVIIDGEDLVFQEATIQLQAKNFVDGTHNNNLVNEHGDLHCIEISGADINSLGHMHHRFCQPNADHHDGGIDISIRYHEHHVSNEVNVPENAVYEENQVTSQMEQKVSPSDVAIDSSDNYLALGREFPDIDALRNALSDMAVETGREYKHGRTSPSKLTMKCRDSRCDWSIQATRLPNSPAFKVVKYQEVHTCVVLTNSGDKDHPQATVRWILSKVQSNIEKDPNMEPMKIVKQMKERYGILISYNKAVKAKTMALDLMRNQKKDSYPLPRPDICCALVKELEGGGTVCKLGLSSDGGSFQHLFWAFPACVEALGNHLRPVIYVCSEKIEIGVLMYARGIDGYGLYGESIQVGFALCVREDEKTWERFLSWLKEFVLPPQPPPTFTIVTDFKKTALTRAVQNVFPHLHHFFSPWSFCVFFLDKFKDSNLYNLCWEACYTFSAEECESYLQEMRILNEGAYEWLESVGSKSHWAIAFSPNKHVSAVTKVANMNDDLVSVLENKLSIVEIVESSRDMVANYFSERRIKGAERRTANEGLTPGVMVEIECVSKWLPNLDLINGHKYQLTDRRFYNDTWVVDLEERSCTCGRFQATEYPCVHAFKVIVHEKLDVKDYLSHRWYSLDAYLATYAGTLPPPINVDISQWQTAFNDIPYLPRKRTQRGRPRKVPKMSI